MNVNWCTGCKCVLANEEVVNGVCERCGSEVVHKVKSQWMLKITAYADKLIDGLDGLDYIERVATQQKNWIGRSHGAEVNFGTTAGDTLTVYTTRCDTLSALPTWSSPRSTPWSRSGWKRACSRMRMPLRPIRQRLPARAILSAVS